MAAVPELGGVKLVGENNYNSLILPMFFIVLFSLFGVAFLVSDMISAPSGLSGDFVSLSPSVDSNSLRDHSALAFNQQLILVELQKINLFSECVIDVEGIRSAELPIDDFGGFRRVSVITLVCPEFLLGE